MFGICKVFGICNVLISALISAFEHCYINCYNWFMIEI